MLVRRLGVRFLFVAALAAAARPARAQIVDHTFRPTRGLLLPGGARAGDGDATAVELNPAQLAYAGAAPFAIAASLAERDTPLPGRGWGFFLAAPLGHSAFGLALQDLDSIAQPSLGAGLPARTKLSLGWGGSLGRRLAIGGTWSHFFGDALGGLDTFDLGASLRIVNQLAVGFVVEDVGKPNLPDGSELPRRWVGEIVLRPLGTRAFEIAGSAFRTGSFGVEDLSPRVRANARVLPGVWVFGEADWARRITDFPAGVTGGTYDRRVSVGLAAELGGASLAVAGNHADLAGPGGTGPGLSLLARALAQPSDRPLVARRHVARLTLEGGDGERSWISFALRGAALARDPAVLAVVVQVDDLPGGLGRAEELRGLIGELRDAGKGVVVLLRGGSTRHLWAASAADAVVVHPGATLYFTGLASSLLFYEGLLDKLGVEAQVVRFGEYKGAFEPFTRRELSDPVRANYEALIDDRFRQITEQIADGRRRLESPREVAALIDRGLFTPPEAVKSDLADAIAADDEADKLVRTWLGRPGIAIREPGIPRRSPRWLRRKVAVVVLDGTIVDGRSRGLPIPGGEAVAGDDTLVDALDEVRTRGDVAAVVLRVNSPGGSALASDRIAAAVRRVREAGKPVVVSFGDVAASGGYYVAAPGTVIFSNASTLTGSIGVIGMKVNAAGLLDRLGITSEVIKRGEKADLLAPTRPWTEEERDAVERSMRNTYDRFLTTVAQGRASRGLSTPARVDALGRGRVFTGNQAKAVGLVDRIGGVVAAIRHASSLAGIAAEPSGLPEVEVFPKPTFAESLRRLVGAGAAALVDARAEAELPLPTLSPELAAAARLILPAATRGPVVLTRLPFEVIEP